MNESISKLIKEAMRYGWEEKESAEVDWTFRDKERFRDDDYQAFLAARYKGAERFLLRKLGLMEKGE